MAGFLFSTQPFSITWMVTTRCLNANLLNVSRLIADATHLAVRNITLRYSAPDRLLHRWLDAGSIYFSVQNAFLISHYPGGNPESTGYNFAAGQNNTPAALTPGTDFSPYPVPRIFTLGVRLGQ